ncbi:MAG: response regulator [Bacteroidetes bacterium]|jgi:DNA-binding NtrC family response regulator|nr:response regulator [Bacteroidota bacterium]MBT5529713.1 response regulator [Cytophagia bacterium]MBT3423776.1 response regulator [Bacteroidota bacterium]MBT3799692.1 response regulator [Bacteroidota bacterium]MBT3934516.1 response regulator [Bacteroidota bacterium]
MSPEKRPLIFIVDDDPMYHKMISHNLKAENFDNVMTFESGEECIKNLDKKPEVIILDYEMKGINGIQTLKSIKEYNKDIKVILCSSQEDMNIVFDSLKFGAFNYVRKNEFAYNKIKFLMKNILN